MLAMPQLVSVGASYARDALVSPCRSELGSRCLSFSLLGLFSFRFLGMVFYQLINIRGFISFPIIHRWNIEKL